MAVRSSSSLPSLGVKDGQSKKISVRDVVTGDYTTPGNRYGSLNQDNFLSLRVAKNVWVFGIFDGHGELGELASQCATECLRTYFYVQPPVGELSSGRVSAGLDSSSRASTPQANTEQFFGRSSVTSPPPYPSSSAELSGAMSPTILNMSGLRSSLPQSFSDYSLTDSSCVSPCPPSPKIDWKKLSRLQTNPQEVLSDLFQTAHLRILDLYKQPPAVYEYPTYPPLSFHLQEVALDKPVECLVENMSIGTEKSEKNQEKEEEGVEEKEENAEGEKSCSNPSQRDLPEGKESVVKKIMMEKMFYYVQKGKEDVKRILSFGTTAVVAVLVNDHLYVGNVGDSRALLLQREVKYGSDYFEVEALTRDHNYEHDNERARVSRKDSGLLFSEDNKVDNLILARDNLMFFTSF
tara:strand:- start:122 stop:1342 length:1221 start_codon:yes stop_codon:yes gene_type:complete